MAHQHSLPMIKASTFRPPARTRPVRAIPTTYEVDERIRTESVRAALHVGTHAPGMAHSARRTLNSVALLVGDVSSLSVAIVLAFTVRVMIWDALALPTWVPIFMGFWVVAGIVLGQYPGWGVGPVDELRSLSRATLFAAAATVISQSLARTSADDSRFVLVVATLLALGLVPLGRYAIRRLLMTAKMWGTPVAVYGAGASAQRLIHLLKDQPHVGLHPVAAFADDPSFWGQDIDGVPVIGDTRLVYPDASLAVCAVSGQGEQRALMEGSLRYYRRVLLIPDVAEYSSLVTNTVDIGGLLGLELRVNLASPVAQWTKRSVEVILTVLAMPLWLVPAGLGALAIWLEDRHNPFFVHHRMGRGGRDIPVWKLRTMVPDAEGVLARALAQDPVMRAEWLATSKLRNDPRITRVGRLIRRLSIDELPQLWNVLRGDMSLVGPRPLPAYHEERLPETGRDMRRHVRPGVTGLWQVSGRSDTGDEAMGWLDAYYVRNWSLWLDAAILFRTFRAAIAGAGAY